MNFYPICFLALIAWFLTPVKCFLKAQTHVKGLTWNRLFYVFPIVVYNDKPSPYSHSSQQLQICLENQIRSILSFQDHNGWRSFSWIVIFLVWLLAILMASRLSSIIMRPLSRFFDKQERENSWQKIFWFISDWKYFRQDVWPDLRRHPWCSPQAGPRRQGCLRDRDQDWHDHGLRRDHK